MPNCGCKSTPCGCKSNATAVAVRTSCGCGGGGCATCEPRAFVRPRFFAGQLLTEDDLDLLGSYVVGKNRLHNRALWGPGVVCGLDVHCDPCGGGSVIVSPGYAIDCCGDDIVVPCPEAVDILALIKELQAHTLGAACADPCDKPRFAPSASRLGFDPKAPVRSYYLYVRYVEDATDPVSPYATGEPCAGQACEPTRIREGHRYELRCTDDNPTFPGIGTRVAACIKNIEQVTAVVADAAVMNRDAQRLMAAQSSLAETPNPVFTSSDITALQAATITLQSALAVLPANAPPSVTTRAATTRTATATTSTATTTTTVDPAPVRAAIEAARVAGSLFARLVITPAAQRPKIPGATTRDAETQLAAALQVIPPAVTAASLPALETTEATTTVALVRKFATLNEPPATPIYSDQLWALGAPLDDALVAQLASSQAQIRAYIGPISTSPPPMTDCQLLAQAEGITPISTGPITATSVGGLAQSAQLSAQVLARLILGCICDAFNPPCQYCDDQAVLLAEICVQDCVVIDVCELVRRFVITWPSLRYWTDLSSTFTLSINNIGKAIEELCCGLRAQLGSGCMPTATTTKLLAGVPGLNLATPQLALATGSAGQAFTQLAGVLPMLQPLVNTTAVVPGGAAPPVDAATQQAIQAAVNVALASTQGELAALRAQVEQLSSRGG